MKTRESWICEQLDREDISQDLRDKYENELDILAERTTLAQIKLEELKCQEFVRRQEIKTRLLAGDQDLVATLGLEEFGGDYEVIIEGSLFVVYSKVAKDDQEHRRVHDSMEKAQADLRYLFYNRLYSKYVRSGDIGTLGELAE